MPTFESMQRGYGNMWRAATIKPGADSTNAERFADKIIAGEAQYRAVQAATGVPWSFIGALHMRESSCDFAGVLHNGEKIIGTDRQTSLVPAGRGPFATWEEAAIDALRLKNLHRVQEWTIERMLYHAEEFNGWGYVGKGVNSAYVWAGTSLEQLGKYVADHVWSSTFDDPQIGIACVLKRLAEKRPDIAAALAGDVQEEPQEPGSDIVVAPPRSDAGQFINVLIPILAPAIWSAYRDKVAPEHRAAIDALMASMFGGAPPAAPVVTPVVASPVAVVAPASTADTKTVGASLIALVITALGMLNGQIGIPVGETATVANQAAVAVPLVTAIAGLTGSASPIVSFGIRLLSAFGQALTTAK